jgi:hypothetical protein
MSRAVLAVLASTALGASLLAGGAQAATPAVTPARPAAAAADVPPATIVPATAGVVGAVPPVRFYDSRATTALAPGEERSVCDTAGSLPIDAAAAVLNLTAVTPTAAGYLTAWPLGTDAPPPVSNLNFAAGTVTSNLAVVPIGAVTCISVRNSSRGTTHLVVDLEGYLTDGAATAPGATQTVYASRLLDTRTKGVALKPGGSLDVQVAGQGTVPPTGVGAAWLNFTVTGNAAAGYLTTYPTGGPRPTTSSLTFGAGETRAGLALAKLGTSGRVTVYNGSSKPVHVVVDASAWVRSGDGAGTLAGITPIAPVRALDTRASQAVLAGEVAYVNTGVGSPPTRASAAVLAVTAVGATKTGYLTVYGTNAGVPATSSVTYGPGPATTNLVVTRLDGPIVVRNGSSQALHVVVDVVGWVNPENAIAGKVVDEAGQGIPNASIYTSLQAGYLGRSATDGSFLQPLPVGVRQVAPCAQLFTVNGPPDPGYAIGCHRSWTNRTTYTLGLGQRLTGADIPLEPAGIVRGTATDSTGAKLSSGYVVLHRAADNRTYSINVTNGAWAIGSVAQGDYYVALNSPSSATTTPYGLSPEWYPDVEPGLGATPGAMAAAGAEAISVTRDSTTTVNLVAEPRAHLTGSLDPADPAQPLPSTARVGFLRANGSTITTATAASGLWGRHVHPGAIKVCGYRNVNAPTVCWEGNVPVDQATPIALAPGEERGGIAITLP